MIRKFAIGMPVMALTVLFFSFWAALIGLFNRRAGWMVFEFGRDLWNEWAEFSE